MAAKQKMNYSMYMDIALAKIQDLAVNSEFEVKELFDYATWESLGKYKAAFGTKFREKIESNSDLGIEQIQKAARRSNKFKKINGGTQK